MRWSTNTFSDLNSFNFNETIVVKMSKEPQPPLGGMFQKEHFGHLADIEDPMEEDIDVPEESQAQKFQFQWRFGPAWYCWLVSCLEENVKFDNFFIRYISNAFAFKLYLEIKFLYIRYLICYLQICGIVFL